MNIIVITPAHARSRHGNRHTADRWAKLLRELGHRVAVQTNWDGARADLMIALHARRSHESLMRFRQENPHCPLVLVLTGTDVYQDIQQDAHARESMHLADRIVVLQDMALRELSTVLRRKTRVIYQSAERVTRTPPLKSCFEVLVSGHLREVKDPFRTAAALDALPAASRIRVTHIGGAISQDMAHEAANWMAAQPRYHWLGEVTHGYAMRLLGRCRLLVISSRVEGGANVASEAIATGVPVIASRIPGNIGMFGRQYSGYFPAGDERALAKLLSRVESDKGYYRRLRLQCAARQPLVSRSHEKAALRALVSELAGTG
jgi:putative glycosyltransferase (TIGR04348 family)